MSIFDDVERASTFYCASCKADGVAVDEDGLCTTCGATACGRLHVDSAEREAMEQVIEAARPFSDAWPEVRRRLHDAFAALDAVRAKAIKSVDE